MLISMHSFLKILKTHKSHKSASKSHKSSSSHDFSNHRPRFPPGYIFTVDDWYHHDEHTHDKDDPVMGHNEKLARGGVACEDVVKKWHEWIFQLPSGVNPAMGLPSNPYKSEPTSENPVNVAGNKVYMTAFTPLALKEHNVTTHLIDKADTKYILIPVITAEACTEEYPSLRTTEELVE